MQEPKYLLELNENCRNPAALLNLQPPETASHVSIFSLFLLLIWFTWSSAGGEKIIVAPGTLSLGVTGLVQYAMPFSGTRRGSLWSCCQSFQSTFAHNKSKFLYKTWFHIRNIGKLQCLFQSLSFQTTLQNKRIGEEEPGTYFTFSCLLSLRDPQHILYWILILKKVIQLNETFAWWWSRNNCWHFSLN